MRFSHKLISLAAIFLVLSLSVTSMFTGTTFADDGKGQKLDEYTTRIVDKSGKTVDREIYPKKPPDILPAEPKVTLPNATATSGMSRDVALAANSLSNVPAFTWCYGCSPTAAAMLAGYYDQPEKGYVNIYTGPANGGVCPLNNVTAWGSQYYGNLCGSGDVTCGFSPLAATKNGLDGRATRGHVDDYWNAYYCTGDPYNGNWTQHGYDSLGDYMGTSQYYNWNNVDGSTTFFNNTDNSPLYDYSGAEPTYRDGCHGIRLFLESKGYTVTSNFNQRIYGYNGISAGFTYAQYKAEIDAGRPVIIQLYGHSMLGVGYSDPSTVFIHNTWSNSAASMTWGQPYSGMEHRGVTVIQLAAIPTTPTVTNTSGATNTTTTSATLNGNLTSTGGQTTTVSVYWGATDGGTTPGSWTNNVSLGTRSAGAFSTGISGLTPYATYFYRCAATNVSGTSWAGSSSSFIAATLIRLIGANDATSGTQLGGYAIWGRWPAASTGNINQVRIMANASGNVKVALYADNAGNPGVLLQAVNTSTPVTAGWNTISIPSTAVTSGTNYWLAFISDADCVPYQVSAGALRPYTTATYAGYSFTTMPPGLLSSPGYYSGIAAWGFVPPATPTVTNASGATSITATTATLNGNLTADGGSATNVTVYWGTTDGGTTPGNWTNNVPLGITSVGAFTTNLTGLTTGTTYYYRCSGTNATGTSWAASTASFVVTAAPVQVLGPADATAGTLPGGYALFDRWAATSNSNVTQIRVKSNVAGNVKVALYADNAGNPGALLQAVNTSTPVVSGWNTISITSTAVTSGTNYWLAFISDSTCVPYQVASGMPRQYTTAAYAGFSFTTMPTGLASSPGYYGGIAGWGVAPGPSIPAVTNASGATAITSTTATLNGNLTSDGGSATSVTIYWGTTDGVTTPGNWTNNVPLGTTPVGAFTTNLTGLTTGTTYYYRCSGTNATGTSWAASTASFVVTAAPVQVLGPADATAGTLPGGYALFDRWAATSNSNVTQIRVKSNVAGNVKVALYADNAGNPGALLQAVNTSTPVVSGWNTISITSTAVTSGTNYWLAFISDSTCVPYQVASGMPRQYTTAAYAGFSFTTMPTGLASSPGYYGGIAGWGVAPGPSIPAVTNASGATAITSTTATLNGNLTSDGGSATSVTIYWGTTDGVTTPGNWTNNVPLGTTPVGAFTTNITGLTTGTTYYYRCSATNTTGISWAASTVSFVPATTLVRILGPADATTGTLIGGYALFNRWAASSSGNISQIRVKANAVGNVKVALYADNAGTPGALMQAINIATPVVSGWNTISIPSTAVTSGTNYWLAFISDLQCVAYQTAAGTPRKYMTGTFATFTFTASPAGLGDLTGYYDALTGWGN